MNGCRTKYARVKTSSAKPRGNATNWLNSHGERARRKATVRFLASRVLNQLIFMHPHPRLVGRSILHLGGALITAMLAQGCAADELQHPHGSLTHAPSNACAATEGFKVERFIALLPPDVLAVLHDEGFQRAAMRRASRLCARTDRDSNLSSINELTAIALAYDNRLRRSFCGRRAMAGPKSSLPVARADDPCASEQVLSGVPLSADIHILRALFAFEPIVGPRDFVNLN